MLRTKTYFSSLVLNTAHSRLECAKRDLLSRYADAENKRKSRQIAVEGVITDSVWRFSKRLTTVGSDMFRLIVKCDQGESPDSSHKQFICGIGMVNQGMLQTFSKHGLEHLCASEGNPFDPRSMEATNTLADSNSIVSSITARGWRLKGEVIVKCVVDVA